MATLDGEGFRKRIAVVSTTATRWRAAVDTSTLLRLLLAFALSFGLWIYVTLRNNPETTIPLRNRTVETRGLPSGSVLMTTLPTVDVIVSGPQTLVENPSQPVRPYIDLAGQQIAVGQRVPIQAVIPAGVNLVGINPSEVTVDVEPLTSAQFPVTMAPLTSAPAGVQLPQPTLEPGAVTVTGARSTIAKIARVIVRVEPGGDPNDRMRLQRPIPLDLANNEVSGPGLEIEPRIIRVTLPAQTTRGAKTVPVRYSIKGQPAAGYQIGSIQTTPASVNISGEADVLQNVTAVETAPIDITDRRQTLVQDVPLIVPPGVTPEQTSVRVDVGIAPIEARVRLTLPVFPRAQPGLRAQITPSTVDVTLKGPVPSIQQIDVGSLRAEVDLLGLNPGVYQVEPKIAGPGLTGLDIVEIQPPKVTVVITAEPSATPPPTGTPTPSVTPTPGAAPR
jgi:YbbR domain-containing protein